MVVNATLAAMAKHAGKRGVKVYHVASSVANPIRVREFVKILFEHFKRNPYIDSKGNPVRLKQLSCVNTMENYRQALDTAFNSPSNVSFNGILYLFRL
jgi:fatty acyl-CoA reductase